MSTHIKKKKKKKGNLYKERNCSPQVAHPPGYPLFTLLAKLFIKVIPVGSVAWRVNLLTAVCGALCASVVYLLIYR